MGFNPHGLLTGTTDGKEIYDDFNSYSTGCNWTTDSDRGGCGSIAECELT